MKNEDRAEYGRAAVDAGTPDRDCNDDSTNTTDTLANIMHWCKEEKIDFSRCMASAQMHYQAEIEEGD